MEERETLRFATAPADSGIFRRINNLALQLQYVPALAYMIEAHQRIEAGGISVMRVMTRNHTKERSIHGLLAPIRPIPVAPSGEPNRMARSARFLRRQKYVIVLDCVHTRHPQSRWEKHSKE